MHTLHYNSMFIIVDFMRLVVPFFNAFQTTQTPRQVLAVNQNDEPKETTESFLQYLPEEAYDVATGPH